MDKWISGALSLAEEIDREIETNGTDIDICWVQDTARRIAWHIRGSVGDPGPVRPVTRPDE